VGRRVAREAPTCLLELALAADAVAASRLVPRDRDVHEALEEIALARRRDPPVFLELLVRLEVGSRIDLLQAAGEAHTRIFAPGARFRRVATILLAGVDLFFRGKLEALLPDHQCVTSGSIVPPDLVIVDIARIDPDEAADAWPDVPLLGFTNHTDKSGLQRAHMAGFDQVLVKSALVERAPQVVEQLVAPPG